MSPEFETLLGEAYTISQVNHDEARAIARLQGALAANPLLSQEAVAERQRLAAVVAARQQGGQHGDHVSAVLSGLLEKALQGGPNA